MYSEALLTATTNIFCLVFEKDNEIIEAIWSIGKTVSFKSTSSQQIFDMRGNLIDTKNLPRVNITEDVTFIKNQKNDYKEVDVKDLEDADPWPMRSVTNQM